MGRVYLAFDRVLEEPVAIKVLRPELVGEPGMARRLRSEIKLARRVSHRNVCRIHEYGEDQEVAYISMEFIEGRNLKEVLRERAARSW
jgi:serine/threonine-protein kinase